MADSAIDILTDFEANNRWITENYEGLKKQYNNQWVALLNNSVVDNDSDLRKLIKRLKAQHSNVYNKIAVDYVTSEEIDLIL